MFKFLYAVYKLSTYTYYIRISKVLEALLHAYLYISLFVWSYTGGYTMSVTVLIILVLTVATAIVSSSSCDNRCEYNFATNEFYGNQVCYTAYDNILQHLNDKTYIGNIDEYIENMCTGECGDATNRILYYEDYLNAVNFNDKMVSWTLLNT